MATDDYQANTRGARRYQFDEEARRKAAERKRVTPFRRLKHGDPKKLKVLVEDFAPSTRVPWLLVIVCAGAAFAVTYLA